MKLSFICSSPLRFRVVGFWKVLYSIFLYGNVNESKVYEGFPFWEKDIDALVLLSSRKNSN
jgi:hypothetical protein